MRIINLTKGLSTKVDDADYEWLSKYKWYAHGSRNIFYAQRGISVQGKMKIVFMHREIMQTPEGMQCDHINNDSLDNQKSNLRNCLYTQNAKNRKNQGKSIYHGVSIRKNDIVAQIQCDGKKEHIGCFKTEEDAAHAYDQRAKELFGES